jgi:AraC-like DNA-binding protein
LHSISKLLFLLISLGTFLNGASQNTQRDSINLYFKQIDYLITNKANYEEDFYDYDALLLDKENARGVEKVDILIKLCQASLFNSLDKAKQHNNNALVLAKTIGYKSGILEATYNGAYLLFIEGDFNNSMKLVKDLEGISYYKDHLKTYADVNTLKSDIYTERGEYDLALETGLKLLDKAEKEQNEYLQMKANASLSHYYLRVGNYSKALSHCLKGLHFIIKFRKIEKFFPKIDEIARMSSKLNDTKGALEAYGFFEEMEKKMLSAGSYIKSSVNMNMAVLYVSNGEYEKADTYLSKALDINYKNKYKFRIPRALIVRADLYLKMKDTTNAILAYEKSLVAAEDINAFDVIKSNSNILAELYKNKGDLSKAYEYEALFNAVKDSLFNNEKEQKIIILEAKRSIKEVTQKKKILELENKAQKARYKIIMVILAFLILISGIVGYSYLNVKNKNKLLFRRTIELAEVQLEMSKRLNIFQTQNSNARKKKSAYLIEDQPIIDEDVKDIILTKLKKLEEQNFFIDPNCSLRQLSEQLKTNPKYLSQVINQEKRSNFSNYINELRINYLLPKLLEDVVFRNGKLSYLAASIGYNNLNTFNSAFKKRQGILPSYFINQLNNESKKRDAL